MILRFETFEFDTEQRELRREGVGLTLQPKVYAVLAYFLRHHDRAVSKDELLDACWPNEFVSESALTRCIRLVRQVVGDDGNRQQVIKTVRGYGYRFVPKVTERSAVPNTTDAEIDLPLPAENTLADTCSLPVPERRQLTVRASHGRCGVWVTRSQP